MKKTLIALAAVTALTGVAAPAFAQPGYDNGYGDGRRYEDRYDNDRRMDVTDRLQRRVERAYENRRISRNEFQRLRDQVRSLERLERQYYRDGRLDRRESYDLKRRADYIQAQLREDRRDRDDRWDYGYRR